MRVEVVDASALAALYFGEPEADAVAERLGEARLAAPGLIRFEMSNIALKKIGKSPTMAPLMLTRLSDFLGSPLEICDIDHGEALALALATRLTAYDASYLWLARYRGCGLVTLDRQLQQAAIEHLST
jgi:predicted nucleic acid-binding protein